MSNPTTPGDFPFSDLEFREIGKLAYESFGFHLEPCKKQLVYSRLARRLRALKLNSFEEYCGVLSGPKGDSEKRELLSALTTNVTQFFRENHHFDQLREEVLPGLLERAKSGGRVRIWSAGCSAGQEAYSLAFTILKLCPDAESYDIRLLGTDIDPVVVQRAVRGQYSISEYSAIPVALQDAHLLKSKDTFTVCESARKLISFRELNLIEPWPMKGKFDVILCRNVAIYFDGDTQSRLWSRFAEKLNPNSHLMIGHSERLSGPATNELKSCGITAYKKTTKA